MIWPRLGRCSEAVRTARIAPFEFVDEAVAVVGRTIEPASRSSGRARGDPRFGPLASPLWPGYDGSLLLRTTLDALRARIVPRPAGRGGGWGGVGKSGKTGLSCRLGAPLHPDCRGRAAAIGGCAGGLPAGMGRVAETVRLSSGLAGRGARRCADSVSHARRALRRADRGRSRADDRLSGGNSAGGTFGRGPGGLYRSVRREHRGLHRG